ncbi:MAG: hypothetical protein WCG01_03575 [bacterium]
MTNQLSWFLVNFIPLVLYALLEALHIFPGNFYAIVGLILFVILIFSGLIAKNIALVSNWWNFSLLPLTTYIASIAFSVLLTDLAYVRILYLLTTFFVVLYFRTVFYFFRKPIKYKFASIENSASYLNFFNFFLLSSSLYGFRSFLSLKDWQFLPIVLIYTVLVFYQLLWAMKLKFSESYKYIILATLVMLEISLAISFLPFEYYVSGLLLSLCYYVISGLFKLHIAKVLNKDRVMYYALFVIIIYAVIFLTVRWL